MNESFAEWITESRDVLLKQRNDSSQAWKQLSDETVISKGGRYSSRQKTGHDLASGKNPPSDTYEIRSSLDSKQLGGILIEAFLINLLSKLLLEDPETETLFLQASTSG